ncbi:hypothetical protein VNO77_44241 [Canavalia gladiata]|uniref:Uncharacterized protein n=1 Tax=Canavalia gladiata TaxID=3824 RepID=A0AAN9JXW1_CANGL
MKKRAYKKGQGPGRRGSFLFYFGKVPLGKRKSFSPLLGGSLAPTPFFLETLQSSSTQRHRFSPLVAPSAFPRTIGLHHSLQHSETAPGRVSCTTPHLKHPGARRHGAFAVQRERTRRGWLRRSGTLTIAPCRAHHIAASRALELEA